MFLPSEKVVVTNVSLLCTPRVSHQIAPMVVTNVAIGKARAAYAQSFALWQQATTEFTCHDNSPRTLVATFNRSQVNISNGNGNGLLFHMTQPISRSTIKAIACSKPAITEH